MAIPGMKPDLPIRAKVRIGVKATSAGGREYPKAVDYFVSEDPDFTDGQKALRIRFPFASPDDNFGTGMEYWRKQQLACYTKDDTTNRPIALRVPTLVKETDEIRGEPIKSGRVPITCTFRECEFFKQKLCKPMGRLMFWLDGDSPSKGIYELDTKSWNSIEVIAGFLSLAGDPRGRVFELSVYMEQRRTEKFPLLKLTEVQVEVNTVAEAETAAALLHLREQLATGTEVKPALANALTHTNPGWRENEALVQRIQDIGVPAAAKALLEKHGL